MSGNIEYYPLTHPQKGIWYTEKLYPGTSIGNIAATLKISTNIDFDLMKKAINLVIEKNDAFRMRITEIDGEPKQYITSYEYRKIDFFDFSNQNIEKLYEWDELQVKTPFNLIDSDLCYFAILKIANDLSGFFIKIHHTMADAWSVILFGNEVMEFYQKLKKGSIIDNKNYTSYIEYIFSEYNYINTERYLKDKKFWSDKFLDIPELTFLKTRKESNFLTSAKRKTFIIPAKLRPKIHKYCIENRISILTLFSSALSLYISRVLNRDDIIFGTPVLNRVNYLEKETIGMFISMVPIRLKIDIDSDFTNYVQYVQKEWMSILKHQRYSADLIIKDIRERSKGFGKLYDIALSYQNSRFIKDENIVSQEGRWHFNCHQTESLNIHINERENDGNLVLDYDYQTNLFFSKEIEFLHDHMIRLLWHAIDNPTRELKRIEMVSEKEKNKILYEFNNTNASYPKEKLVHQIFEEQVEKIPDSVAIVFEEKSMTYRELNEKSNQLARFLRNQGVKADSIVGIMVYRSFEMIIGILAILKAGGAYLPLDPNNPADRIRYMLEDSKAQLLLASNEIMNKISFIGKKIDIFDTSIYAGLKSNLDFINKSNNLIYVIYTSGSTGKPKGVMIQHYSVINRINWMQKKYPIYDGYTILQKTTYTFDVSVWELFWWFFSGAKLALLVPMGEKDPAKIVDAIYKHKSTTIHFVPSMLNAFLDYNTINDNQSKLKSLKQVFASGKALTPQSVAKFNKLLFLTNGTQLYNLYGPTEATVDVSYFDCSSEIEHKVIPIGKPIDNTQLYIMDSHHNIQPIGIAGELYISGDALARGYLNNPELTAEKFIENPFTPGERMYKTGDLARWFAKGDIEYLGRIDQQVKIRGFRIELGEIENQILEYDGIIEVSVNTRDDKNGNKILCAYIASNKTINTLILKKYLSKKLPNYMVPSYFVIVEKLPLTSSGKIDRKALPEPVYSSQISYTAPRDKTEILISEIWSQLFSVEKVGIDDSFFDLGGDSLQVMQFISHLSKYDMDINIHDVYEYPTIRELGSRVISCNNENKTVGAEKQKLGKNKHTNQITFLNHSMEVIPITQQILSKALPTLDAAALCYFPDDILREEYFRSEKMREKEVVLFNYIETGLGHIGIIGLPVSISSLYNDKYKSLAYCMDAMKLAKNMGAKVVSLTGLIPSATRYGLDIADKCHLEKLDVQVTTGHTTTSASVILSLERLLDDTGRNITQEKLCVVGLGSIGTTVISLLLSVLNHPSSITLCDVASKKDFLNELKCELRMEYGYNNDIDIVLVKGTDIPDKVYESTLIIGATNVPDVVDVDRLKPGTLIIDDSGPHCFSKDTIIKRLYNSGDIIFTEGGVLQSPVVMKKRRYLPDFIHPDIMNKYWQLFLSEKEITGCILSSLLSAKFRELQPVVGNVRIEDCCRHYNILKKMRYKAAILHFDDFVIPEIHIEHFRNNFGCVRRAINAEV